MRSLTLIQKIFVVLAALFVAELWQLACHFTGWIPTGSIGSALILGLLNWALFFILSVTSNAFELYGIGDFFLLVLGGAIVWLGIQICGFSFTVNFFPWLCAIAIPTWVLGVAAKTAAYSGKRA